MASDIAALLTSHKVVAPNRLLHGAAIWKIYVKDVNMASMQNFVCVCFYTRNYFIAQHSMHVTFTNEEQLTYEYEQVKIGFKLYSCHADLSE